MNVPKSEYVVDIRDIRTPNGVGTRHLYMFPKNNLGISLVIHDDPSLSEYSEIVWSDDCTFIALVGIVTSYDPSYATDRAGFTATVEQIMNDPNVWDLDPKHFFPIKFV